MRSIFPLAPLTATCRPRRARYNGERELKAGETNKEVEGGIAEDGNSRMQEYTILQTEA